MEWVITDLLPSLADRGIFGEGKFLSVCSDDNSDIGFQFASQVAFVQVKMLVDSGETKSVPIVIKIPFPDEGTRQARDCDGMFSNEVNMFTDILPFFNSKNVRSYPKFYYGSASSGKDPLTDVVIAENIKHAGFSLSQERLYLDYDHIALTMKKIGELHAWSYTAKARDRRKFFNLVSKVRRLVATKDESFDFELLNYETIKRGVKPLLEKGKDEDILKKFVESIKHVWSVQERLFDADEPFGAIIHGDFCKNNIFYSYNSDGKPTDCMYFDFQLSKYSSPAIDLSFFLYMHTDTETRAKYWDEFLYLYWNSVRSNVPSDITLPSFEEFHKHFSSRAVYGYIHCSYFKPQMVLETPLDLKELFKLSAIEKYNVFLNLGGEEGEKCIVDIVSHLLEKKYLHSFLDYYSTISKYL